MARRSQAVLTIVCVFVVASAVSLFFWLRPTINEENGVDPQGPGAEKTKTLSVAGVHVFLASGSGYRDMEVPLSAARKNEYANALQEGISSAESVSKRQQAVLGVQSKAYGYILLHSDKGRGKARICHESFYWVRSREKGLPFQSEALATMLVEDIRNLAGSEHIVDSLEGRRSHP